MTVRSLAASVVAVTAGGGLVLLGASRAWSTEVVPQPAPLSPQEIVHTGASLAPALPALGFVALAGAGALLATRGPVRRLVGALLGTVAAAVVALVVSVLARGGLGVGWPVACLLGAVLVGGAGVVAVRRGARWPVMGRRYERALAPVPASADRAAGHRGASAEMWDALERGEDPTRD